MREQVVYLLSTKDIRGDVTKSVNLSFYVCDQSRVLTFVKFFKEASRSEVYNLVIRPYCRRRPLPKLLIPGPSGKRNSSAC